MQLRNHFLSLEGHEQNSSESNLKYFDLIHQQNKLIKTLAANIKSNNLCLFHWKNCEVLIGNLAIVNKNMLNTSRSVLHKKQDMIFQLIQCIDKVKT